MQFSCLMSCGLITIYYLFQQFREIKRLIEPSVDGMVLFLVGNVTLPLMFILDGAKRAVTHPPWTWLIAARNGSLREVFLFEYCIN